MWNKSLVLLLGVIITFCYGNSVSFETVHDVASENNPDWWENAVFYQIYPATFKDSNDDGIGDLAGITSKLSYLKETGVTAIWISPIYDSPLYDGGYDVRDFKKIYEKFGNDNDFDNLIKEAKKLDIKVILDFVPNHTSDEHQWFKNSIEKVKDYEDFYIWHDGDQKTNPNNWISEFKGSAWEWNDKRKQFYLHQFTTKQPDLNYANPNVVNNITDTLKYWLDKGVDGFRMDAVPFLFEDPNFKDAPVARGYESCTDDPKCQDKTLILKDHDKTYELIYTIRDFVDKYVKDHKDMSTKVIMTEAYSSVENTMLYYQSADGTKKGAHFTFNFNFITDLNKDFTVDHLYDAINKWLVYLPKGCRSNWVLGNHDNHRVATRLGVENVDAFNMLTAFLPGVMVTYNGEEIGMVDGEVTWDQKRDNSATDPNTFNEVSRDFERTPFQWDGSKYAGFMTEDSKNTPWLPVGTSKDSINLDSEMKNDTSNYNIYKHLMEFRKNFQNYSKVDSLAVIKLSDNVLQLVRQRDDVEYVYLFNIGNEEETIEFYKKSDMYMLLVASGNSDKELKSMVSEKLKIGPHESLILHTMSMSRAPTLTFSLTLLIGLFSALRYFI